MTTPCASSTASPPWPAPCGRRALTRQILFVNTALADKEPSLRAARALGQVAVVGAELPDWAAPHVDWFLPGDTRDPAALDTIIERLRQRHAATPFDAVVTFWDHGVVPAARIAGALGLPGSSVAAADAVRHKGRMREGLSRAGVPQPRFTWVAGQDGIAAAVRSIGFPAIHKPAGGGASTAICLVRSEEELRVSLETTRDFHRPDAHALFAAYPDEYIIEEFMDGREVSVEGVVARGAVRIAAVTEKWTTPDVFTEYMHLVPARLTPWEHAAV